jgi:glycerol kinase
MGFLKLISDRNLQFKCGLTMNPYFSVFKLLWLMENVPEVLKAIQEKRCMFGTIDSWLIWVIISD